MARTTPRARALPVLDFISHSPEQTWRVGRRLGQRLHASDLVLLSGTFGAGKTLLTQGLASGLAVEERVTSPSFALVNEYDGRDAGGRPVRLYHVDLYRLDDPAKVETIGLEEYLGAPEGISVVEWPEHLGDVEGLDRLLIEFEPVSETKRRLRFTPHGERYAALLGALKAEAFGVDL
jgi:tRNA threonylcarbamoyladenosine biosynthesis protein TsaE